MRWEAKKFLSDLEKFRKLDKYGGFDIELLEKECLFGTAVIFLAIFTVSRLYFFSSEETGYSMLLSVSLAGIFSPFIGFLTFLLGAHFGKAMAEKISMKKAGELLLFLERIETKNRLLSSLLAKGGEIKECKFSPVSGMDDEEKYSLMCEIYELDYLLSLDKGT